MANSLDIGTKSQKPKVYARMDLVDENSTTVVAKQLIDTHELHCLECSGAWEPTGIPGIEATYR